MNDLDLLRLVNGLQPAGWSMPGQYEPGMLPVVSSAPPGYRNVTPPGLSLVGQYEPGMVVRETDPQKIATTLSRLRTAVETAGGGGGSQWAGTVIGDTPGGAQSALLSLRSQNIQAEQEAARRADANRNAALDRQLRAQLESHANALRSTQLADQLLSSASARDIAAREQELRRILGIGDIEVKRAGLATRNQPTDNSLIEALLGVRPQLDEASSANDSAIGNLLAQIQTNARTAGRANNLLVDYGEDGLPQFKFLNPAAATSPEALYAAEDAAYTMPGRDLRSELNNLLAEQARLEAGRKTYANDWAMALKTRNDRQAMAVPAATEQALAQVLAALQAAGTTQRPANTLQSRAAQLLAERGNVVGPAASRRPPAPKAAKTWRLGVDGRLTR